MWTFGMAADGRKKKKADVGSEWEQNAAILSLIYSLMFDGDTYGNTFALYSSFHKLDILQWQTTADCESSQIFPCNFSLTPTCEVLKESINVETNVGETGSS